MESRLELATFFNGIYQKNACINNDPNKITSPIFIFIFKAPNMPRFRFP